MVQTVNRGVASFFAIGDAMPIVAGSAGRLMNILTESVQAVRGVIDGNAMMGTRSHYANRAREGIISVGGSFSVHPTTLEMALLLKYGLGGTPSGTSYPLAELIPAFNIQKAIEDGTETIQSYPNVYCNVLTIGASRGQPLAMDMSVLGMTEVENQTFATGLKTPDTTTNVFVFHDLTISYNSGTAVKVFDFSITINNALDLEMVANRNAQAVFPTDRVVTVSHPTPQGNFTQADFRDTEVSLVATFSYNNQSLVLTLPVVRYTMPDPVIASRSEIRQPLNGIAFRTAGAAELTVTLDNTP